MIVRVIVIDFAGVVSVIDDFLAQIYVTLASVSVLLFFFLLKLLCRVCCRANFSKTTNQITDNTGNQ